MQIVDVQLRSNDAWFVIRVFTRSINFSGYELFNSSEKILSISVFSRPDVEHNLSALKKRPLINLCFVADDWQEWKSRYLPVFVDFLYTVVSSVPSGFLLIRQSRKGSSPFSFSFSTVNWIASLMLLMCTRKLRATYFDSITKVSSTYRFPIFGGRLNVVIAMFSRLSIKMLATTEDKLILPFDYQETSFNYESTNGPKLVHLILIKVFAT